MKLEKIIKDMKIEQIIEDMLLNEEDFNLGYISYKTFAKNKRVLENELKLIKNNN